MAVACTNITTGSQDATSTSNTASITPVANRLYLVTVISLRNDTTNPQQPTLSGDGLTWDVVQSVVYDDSSSSRRRETLFRSMGASPSSGALTIDMKDTQTRTVWVVDECTGMDTSGSNGAGAVVQSAQNHNATGIGTSLTVTLAAFGSVNNATYGTFADGGGNTTTAGSGFAKVGEKSVTSLHITSEFRNDNDTTCDMTWSSDQLQGGIAIEIKAAAAEGVAIKNLASLGVG